MVHIPDSVYLSIDQLYAKADFSSSNGSHDNNTKLILIDSLAALAFVVRA